MTMIKTFKHGPMRECPVLGCEIYIPPNAHSCPEHWRKLSAREQYKWMYRNRRKKEADNERHRNRTDRIVDTAPPDKA